MTVFLDVVLGLATAISGLVVLLAMYTAVSARTREIEFVSIMGSSGSGKSTLLHVIGGLLSPTGGRVFVRGEDITSMSDSQRTDLRRREIGFVFQRFNLFPTLSVEENLVLAERIHAGGVLVTPETARDERSF